MQESGHGASMQALRERGAREERADAGTAALLVQGVWPDLHQHARPGKPLALKAAAVLLSVSGLSLNRTAKRLGVSTPTIQAWLEPFAQAYAQKPEPEGRAGVIERDEMGPSLTKRQSRSGSGRLGSGRLGSGRLGIVLQGHWWTGKAAGVTRPPVSAL